MTDRPAEGSGKNTRWAIVTKVAVSVPQRQISSIIAGSRRKNPSERANRINPAWLRPSRGRSPGEQREQRRVRPRYGVDEVAQQIVRRTDQTRTNRVRHPTNRPLPAERSHGIYLPVPLSVGGNVLQLCLDPIVYSVVHHGLAQRSCPAFALLVWHREGCVDGLGLLV